MTTVYLGGLPYDDATQALVTEAAAPVRFVNGIGITDTGAVAINTADAISHYHAGLPRTADGALAVTDGGVVELGAFSDGFDDGFDI